MGFSCSIRMLGAKSLYLVRFSANVLKSIRATSWRTVLCSRRLFIHHYLVLSNMLFGKKISGVLLSAEMGKVDNEAERNMIKVRFGSRMSLHKQRIQSGIRCLLLILSVR